MPEDKQIKPSFRINKKLWDEFCSFHPNMASSALRTMIAARCRKLRQDGVVPLGQQIGDMQQLIEDDAQPKPTAQSTAPSPNQQQPAPAPTAQPSNPAAPVANSTQGD